MGIDTRHQALARCFFVPGGTVDLSRKIKPIDAFGFQSMFKLFRGYVLIALVENNRIRWRSQAGTVSRIRTQEWI